MAEYRSAKFDLLSYTLARVLAQLQDAIVIEITAVKPDYPEWTGCTNTCDSSESHPEWEACKE